MRYRLSVRGLRVLEVAIIILLIAASVPPMHLLNRRLDARMEAIKREVIGVLEARIGRRLSYDSISPSIFGFLAVRELRVYSREDPEAVILRINRIKIHYNIFKLFRAGRPVDAVRTVQLSNSQFTIDQDRDRELLSLLRQLGNSGGEALPELRVSGANIALRYTSRNSSITLSKLFFDVGGREDTYTLSIRSMLAYESREEGFGPRLQSRVRLSGRMDRMLRWADISVRVYSLATELLSLTRQTFQVSYREKRLTITKVQDRSPLDIQLLYDFTNRELRGNFKAENYRPANALALTGPLEPYDRLLDSGLSGGGSFVYDRESGRLNYTLDLEGQYRDAGRPLELRVATHLYGDDRVCFFEPLIIRSNRGSIEFTGNVLLENLLPAGALELIAIRSPNGRSLNAAFLMDRQEQRLAVTGSRISIDGTRFEDFSLSVLKRQEELEFSLAGRLGGTLTDNALRAEGRLRLGPTPRLSASVGLKSIPLNILYRILSSPEQQSFRIERRLASLTLDTRLEGESDFRSFAVGSDSVQVEDLHAGGNSLRFGFSADNSRLEIRELDMAWNTYRLSGDFLSTREEEGAAFLAAFIVEDIPYRIQGALRPGKDLVLEGSYGLQAELRFHGTASPSLQPAAPDLLTGSPFALQTESLPLPFKQGLMLVSLNAEGIRTKDGLVAVTRRAELRNIPFIASGDNSLVFSAALTGKHLDLPTIAYTDSVSSLHGEGLVTFTPADLTVGFVGLEDAQRLERYSLTFTLGPRTVDANLEFSGMPLAHLGDLAVSGDVSGTVSVNGDRDRPLVQARLKLDEGRLNVDPLAAELTFNYQKSQLVLTDADIAYLSHRIEDARGRLELTGGDFSFNSGYRADYFGKTLTLDLSLTGSLGADLRRGLDIFAAGLAGRLRLANIRVNERPAGADWLFDLRNDGSEFQASGGPEDAIHLRYASSGAFQLLLENPLPVQGAFRGRATRATIDSTFDVAALELSVINSLARTDIFHFTTGRAQGSVSISGPINDPDFYGILQVIGGEMDFALSPNPVGPVNGRLVFDEKSFVMERMDSVSGQTPFAAEGIFYMDHWVPKAFELTFETDNYPGIWIRSVFGPVFTDGYALGTIHVRGEGGSTWIDGDLLINSAQISTARVEEAAEETGPLWVDLKFTTGRRVEFYWPSINFPIIRAYADQDEKISLSLDGNSGLASLRGEAEIRGGEIFYFDRSFYLKEGSITFGESVDEFDPRIRALAEIRERDENNEDIRIYLETDDRLSEFSPRFYSVPSRPDLEIMDMVSGSISTRLEERGLGVSAVLLTSEVVSQFGILQPFERAVRQFFGLDLFSVRTQVVQNVLLRGLLGEKSTGNPVNPLDNTTLSLGKYLGTDLFLEMLVRFRAPEPWSADAGASQIQTEGELNFEWETPFFLLEWSIVPQHPENLFVTDNTIGLKWKFSY